MSIAIKDRVDNPPFYSHNINMPNIVSPRPGQVIEGGTVELMVGTPSYKIVDFEKYTKATSGQGHLHIWVDQTNFSKTSAIKATSNIYKLENLIPGPHTVTVELVTNNHNSFSPKNISSVSFTTTPKPETKKLQSPLMLTLITLVLLLIATYLMLSKPKVVKKSKK